MGINFTKKKIFIGLATLLVAAGAFVAVLNSTSDAITMGSRRDCTADAIMHCGATTQAELLRKFDANAGSTQAVFAHYGITRGDIAGTTSEVKKGTLKLNGTIVVGGKTVATGARSVYRVHPGTPVKPVTIAGKTFYEGAVSGSYRLEAEVYVLYKEGRFHSAIQASCGNPIPATPTEPKAVYSCDNLTASKIDRTRFRFTASAQAKNNAQIVSYNYNFGNGVKTTSANRVIEHNYAKPGTYTATVTVNVRVDGKIKVVSGSNCKVTVKVEQPPKPPVYKCDSLTAAKINRTTYRFTARATAQNGAQVVSYTYNFGNGRTATTTRTTLDHTYTAPGTYTATVTANIKVNGKTVPVSGAKCRVTIKVEEEPKVPVYKCENLTAKRIDRRNYEFTATASATNATIRSYTFYFGDGTSRTINTSATTAKVTREYADRAATYNARVVVTMTDGKTAPANPNCKATVKVTEAEKPSITIEKKVNGKEHDKVPVGTEFTYEIVVRNTGNTVLKDAAVRDQAPSQVTLLSADRGTVSNNVWTYTIPELRVGGVERFTLKAKYDKYVAGVHKNNVCVDTPTVPGGPDDCDDATTETDEPIKVCDLRDNTIKTIQRSEFDESHMTTDLSKCEDMKVCIIEDKTIKTIKKNEFDESTMTTDLSKCKEEETPPELPQTGLETFIGGGIGLGSITAAGYYWVASRRNLLSALLNK